jgi:hypothetical protein
MERLNFVGVLGDGDCSPALVQPVINPVLREVLLTRRRFLLHAAGVLMDGLGILFIAISGGGKTTAALSVVRGGGKLISDDLVVLEASGFRPALGGILKAMTLREGTVQAFEELRDHVPPDGCRDPSTPTRVAASEVYGTDRVVPDGGPLDVVYCVKVSQAGPSVKRLPAGEAIRRLALSHAFCRGQPVHAGSIMAFRDVVASVRVYELETGPDPARLGHWLQAHASEHATAVPLSPV